METSCDSIFFWGFLFGFVVASVFAFLIRLRELSIIDEANDIEKIAKAIQRYYFLIKKGKATEANKKAVKKLISVFSRKVINSSLPAVESALLVFKKGVFLQLKNDVLRARRSCERALPVSQMPNLFDNEQPSSFEPLQSLISPEQAIQEIEKAFSSVEIIGKEKYYKILGFLLKNFFIL